MPTKVHLEALRSEIASLEAMLATVSEKDKLGRASFQKRLNDLRQNLEEAEVDEGTANVALVFDGDPVRGSRSIDAEFAGKALQEYQELVTRIVSHAERGEIAERGPIPVRHQQVARLNVTSLVHGSFGFVLEEDGAEQTRMFDSQTKEAISQLTDLLSEAVDPDEQSFRDRLELLDIRVFQSLRKFVETLHRGRASLRIAEQQRDLRLNSGNIERAYARVTQSDIEESVERVQGELLGIVPIQRRFDFRRADDGSIIGGSVSDNLSADYLERVEREELVAGRVWTALIKTKVVSHPDGRHARTSFYLLDLLDR